MYSLFRCIGCALVTFTSLVAVVGMAAPLDRQRLAEPLPSNAPTLFERLPVDATGLQVDNRYDDPRMWGARYREFMGGGMGSGVAVGDYDGDGWVDLYVSTKTKPGRLFRNRGKWKFEDVTDSAGVGETTGVLSWLRSTVGAESAVVWRQGAVFADVNNDGWLDLHVSRNAAPNLLYINQGNGTFVEEAERRGLDLSDGSVVGAFADYDRDGWLDVLILTNQVDGTEPQGRPDRLFRNRGDGFFVEVTEAAGLQHASFGHAATWFDYNQDRWPDLYIANDFSGPDYLYRNNGDGTFTNVVNEVVPHTPYSSMGADTSDINNDGHFDLLVADMATTTREKDRRGLAASRDDMLAASTKAGVTPQYMRNALWLNTGTGIFREAACWAGIHATDWTWSVRWEDFDQDGWEDLHVTNGMVREANNSDLLAAMMRALSDAERIRVVKNAPPLSETNLAYRNLRGQGFEPVTEAWGLEEVGVTFGAATGDFDNDGDLDLVSLNFDGGLSVYRNTSRGAHRILVRLRGTRSNRFGAGAIVRVEADGLGQLSRLLTIARGYASGSELVAHFGLAQVDTITRLTVEWPAGTKQVFTNLPADHAYVITEPAHDSSGEPPVECEPWFDDQAAETGLRWIDKSPIVVPDREQPLLPFRTDRRGPAVAVGDATSDGHDDIYLGATAGSPARLLIWKEGTYHDVPIQGLTPSPDVEDGPALWLDVDGDGTTELLVTRTGAKASRWPAAFRPVVLRHEATGRFSPTDFLPDIAINAGAACAADVDQDGDVDVFLGARSLPGEYPVAPRSILLRNERGRLVNQTTALPDAGVLGLVKSALFRDVDQDGHVDLLLAIEWGSIRYLRNDGLGNFVDRTAEAGFSSGGRGWWNGLAAADFNADGILDYVAGNLGLNTPYHASVEQPLTLLYGDFAQNGTSLLIEAVSERAALYPTRSRNDLGARIPAVLRKYPKNDDYARASLPQILGEQAVNRAARWEVDNLQSGVLLSQPGGRFRFIALPRVAQLGPINGIVAHDFDSDGHEDILVTQNSKAAIPHHDGGVGCFLRGHGDGTFSVVEPEQSGVVLTGSTTAVALLDVAAEGRPGVFYTGPGRSSGYLAVRAGDTTQGLAVRLRGPPGNPTSIGARARFIYSDGTSLVKELGQGGGWLSQEPAALFVSQSHERRIQTVEISWPNGRVSSHGRVPESGVWVLAAESNQK